MNDLQKHKVEVAFDVSQTGGKLTARSFTISALDRLVGEVIDFAGIPLSHRNKMKRLGNEHSYEQAKAAKNVLMLTSEPDREVMTRALNADARKMLRQQENKESIARIAYENLRIDPFFETELDREHEIKEDWANYFESYAEKASDPDVQQLWGAILSGEIKNPGSYSLSALRVLSELSQKNAELFRSMVSKRISNHVVYKDPAAGEDLSQYLLLENAGLLTVGGGSLNITFHPGPDGLIRQFFGEKIVVAKPLNSVGGIPVPAVGISAVGQELCSLFLHDCEASIDLYVRAISGQSIWIYEDEFEIGPTKLINEKGERIFHRN